MPVVATNTAANYALISLARNSRQQDKSLLKLASGSRIVTASDDAAGLAVATSLQADISTLRQTTVNAQQAISLLQFTDGVVARAMDMAYRMLSLATQSLSGSVSDNERLFLDTEYGLLEDDITNMETEINFNGLQVVAGSYNHDFQVGVSSTDIINVSLDLVDLGNLNATGEDIDTFGAANAAFSAASGDIDLLSRARAQIGSYLSRFEYRGDVIATSLENLLSAKSAISDVDIAAEQTKLVSSQVLTESAIAALAQANQMKQGLLALVR